MRSKEYSLTKSNFLKTFSDAVGKSSNTTSKKQSALPINSNTTDAFSGYMDGKTFFMFADTENYV